MNYASPGVGRKGATVLSVAQLAWVAELADENLYAREDTWRTRTSGCARESEEDQRLPQRLEQVVRQNL
jgi:hypothetical protein